MDSAVRSHYNARPDKNIDARNMSPIIRLKNFNNWVKSVLIGMFCPSNASVLDLCCGKGGDLQKWKRQSISQLVCMDIADVSVQQAHARFSQGMFPFHALFYTVDCFGDKVHSTLSGRQFDLISCQFALHYAFESQQKAFTAMQNVASHLKQGAYFIGTVPNANLIFKRLSMLNGDNLGFGNDIYNISFETRQPSLFGHKYWFELADAIDNCPEFLINVETLCCIAEHVGLKLVYWKPFHELFQEESLHNLDLIQRMNVFDERGCISDNEWEAIGIYCAFAFQKV